MSFVAPPVVILAERVLSEIERAVQQFPRAHKYVSGADLRRQAMKAARLTHRAWRDRANQAEWVSRLRWAVDDIKLTMQLASRVRAFHSFAQFEHVLRFVSEFGRQVGGWYKQHHPKGQIAAAASEPQRAKILSAQAASRREAKP